MLTLCLLLLSTAAPQKCSLPILMVRTEAQPRSAGFDVARTEHEAAARNDSAHAEALRAAAAALISRVDCK